tara:strand:+ start:6910 stop:7692 length:783 start_codon:yes stop_codon:yes gene_type:complete
LIFNKNRFSDYNTYSDPFPILEIKNFLSHEEAKNICNIIDETNFDELVMGNRKNIRKGTELFKQIIERNEILNKLHYFFNDKQQFEYFYEKLSEIVKNTNSSFDLPEKPKIFNNQFFAYKSTVHKSNKLKKIINFFQKKFINLFKIYKDFVYFDLVISEAGIGYKLKTHKDKPSRLIVFLLYLNDLNETDGGSLEIYSSNNSFEPIEINKKFIPEAGKLIVFLSNPVSYHNVEEIKKKSISRKFIYGSYSTLKDISWKKN